VSTKLPPGPPMDLANMRQNGVRSLDVICLDYKAQSSGQYGRSAWALGREIV
jgi:hypothetical protein